MARETGKRSAGRQNLGHGGNISTPSWLRRFQLRHRQSGGGITACTTVQAVVKANSQSNGKGQILTPGAPKSLKGFR